MIARRGRAAARLSQTVTYASKSSPSTASTSYVLPHLTFHSRGLASSLSQSFFAPSPIRLKKKSKSGSSKEILVEEESFKEEEEEDDLFAISAEDIASKVADKAKKAVREKVPFQQIYEDLTGKLQYMDPEESAFLDLSHWKLLVESASTEEDLKQCLEVAKLWKKQTYSVKSKLQRLTLGETWIIFKQARNLDCPEVLFEVIMNRKNNGFEYDLDLLRQIQAALTSRMGSKNSQIHIRKAAIGNAIQSASNSAAIGQEGQVQEMEQVRRAKLSNIDRTLILAASTSVFSPINAVVDDITLLLAIYGIVQSFKLTKEGTIKGNDDFYSVEVYPRMARALTVLCKTPSSNVHPGIDSFRKTDQEAFRQRCKDIQKAVVLLGSEIAKVGEVNLGEVKAILDRYIGQDILIGSIPSITAQGKQQTTSSTL